MRISLRISVSSFVSSPHGLDQLVPEAARTLGILPHGGAFGRVFLDRDRQILDRLAIDERAGDLDGLLGRCRLRLLPRDW